MSWFSEVQAVFAREPELYIAYLHGQQLGQIPHLMRNKPRTCGVIRHCLAFLKTVLKNTRLRGGRPPCSDGTCDFLFFAGTQNQIDSLNPTIKALQQKATSVLAFTKLGRNDLSCGGISYQSARFTPLDSIKAVALLLLRGPRLLLLLRKGPLEVRDWYLIQFCMCYAYVPYFLRLLLQVRPAMVVVANDHSVPNRSLIAAAHHLGVKTAYLQHASVSPLFPALRFDYAFLDGRSAMETYLKCEHNVPPSDVVGRAVPNAFLSGQKKVVGPRCVNPAGPVGFAINALDDPVRAVSLCHLLVRAGFSVRLRWHPAQSEADVQMLMDGLSAVSGVELNNPKKCRVSQFLSGLCCLVAGNSSILLEAALAGVRPLYYELSPADSPDYYGYVKSGLAIRVADAESLLQMLRKNSWPIDSEKYKQAVRYYSSTYLTEWDGREGELVADSLIQLRKGFAPNEIWGYEPWLGT